MPLGIAEGRQMTKFQGEVRAGLFYEEREAISWGRLQQRQHPLQQDTDVCYLN